MKRCISCKSEGPFYRKNNSRDGLDYYCKKCRNAQTGKTNSLPTNKLRKQLEENLARLDGRRGDQYFRGMSAETRRARIEGISTTLTEVKKRCALEARERKNHHVLP